MTSFVAKLFTAVGSVAIVFVLAKVHASWNEYDFSSSSRFAWSAGYGAMLVLGAYGVGLPDIVRRPRQIAGAALAAPAIAALGVSAVQLFVGDALLPRFVVLGSALALVPWYVVMAAVAQGARNRSADRDRVVCVAAPAEVLTLAQDLSGEPERPATIVGSLSEEDAQTAGALDALVGRSQATLLVLSQRAQAVDGIVHQAALLHQRGVRVRTLSGFYEEWIGKLPVSELERLSLMFDISELHRSLYTRVRRVFDLALAALGAFALIALIPIILVGNAVANRGPLLYRQLRVGKGGRTFTIVKLRTMRPDDRAHLPNEWTTEDDPRITRFGRALRVTHLDELPQVLNILAGDLSVVGPRPEQPHYVSELVQKLPYYDLRHLVQPGLTGWAQVKYGYAGSETDALEKLQYEFYYLRHQGVFLDLRILGRTLRAVLGRRGR